MRFYFFILTFLATFLLSNFARSVDIENSPEQSLEKSLKSLNKSPVDYHSNCASCATAEAASHPFVKLQSKENNQNIELSLISEKELNNLFKEFAQNEDIPFAYPLDGCYARAMAMVQIMENKGIIAGKAFVEGKLIVDTENFGEIRWSYHVAPVVMVKKGNTNIPFVIDPSLFDHPTTYEEWKKKLLEKPKAIKKAEYFTNRFAYGPPDKSIIRTSYDEDTIIDAQEDNKNHVRMIEMMKLSNEKSDKKE